MSNVNPSGPAFNRWFVVVGAIFIQLCLGALYSWSAFTAKLGQAPFNYSKTEKQIIFSVGLLTFAIVMALFAGRWQRKVGPRKVCMTGGLVLGAGFVVAGLAGAHFWVLLLGIGVLGGTGIGLAYVCPIAALVKWFPDKKGLITGLAVAGFGFGALIWIKLTTGFKFGTVNLTPGWGGLFGMGWTVNNVFMLYGLIFAAVISLGSLVMVNPPEGWSPQGWSPQSSGAAGTGIRNFSEREMVGTPQYWLLLFAFTIGSLAGLMVIGVIQEYGNFALTARGLETTQANTIALTAMGLFYALCNGMGRILWGKISDRLGRRNSIILLSGIQGLIMITFYYAAGFEWGLSLSAAVIGFNYGGCFALFPAATADLFGNKNVGTNYPWVFLAYGLGGLIGPILGGYMGQHQLWFWAFIPAGVACLVAALLASGLRPPQTAAERAKKLPTVEPARV